MSKEEENPDVTDQSDPGTGTKNADPGTDWEKRYKGLQKTYQKQVDSNAELQATIDQLTADLEESRQSVSTLEKNLKTIEGNLGESSTTISDLQSKYESVEKMLSRKDMILSEFPDLAEFETKGLLPSAEGDELKTALANFKEALDARTKQSAESIVKDAQPPEPKNKSNVDQMTSDQAYNLAMKHAGKDPVKHREYMDLYMELTNEQE